MIESADCQNSNLVSNNQAAYSSAWEFLSDQLSRLDLLIRQVFFQGSQTVDAGYILHAENLLSALNKKEASSSGNEMLEEEYNQLTAYIRERIDLTQQTGQFIPFLHLVQCFSLNPIEADILLVCLAPSLDLKYQKLYAFIQGDATLKFPTRWLIYTKNLVVFPTKPLTLEIPV